MAHTAVAKKQSEPKMSRALVRQETIAGYLFLLPSLIFFIGFVIYPMVMCIFTSFFDSSMNRADVFIGLQNYVELFLSAKRIEGCSEKSLKYYKATIEAMLCELKKDVKHIVTDDIRGYLTEYQEKKKSSKVTIDNIRRILSSFFSWLEDEDYILKSPVRRIHRVKTGTNIKETYSDEALELMRDNCSELRDLAIIVVYFDARTKIHLQNYLESRTDDNPALFVSLKSPHERLKIGGVEVRLREFGKQLGINKSPYLIWIPNHGKNRSSSQKIAKL